MRILLVIAATAAVLAVQDSRAQTNSATNSAVDLFVKPKAKTQTNVVPGPDGLIRLEAKPELVDLIPTLSVASLKQAVEFYASKLGFEMILQSGNYVAVGRDGVQIGFVFDKNAAKGYKPSFYIRMVRIEEYYKQVKATGVKLTSELKTSSSNMKEFSLSDPDGYTLIFGEYVGK
ncbi:MAG: VOC family protein [Verrucomicrobia bacterium]|nr:VOC family protein [Verrucomicrobiota bacterium]